MIEPYEDLKTWLALSNAERDMSIVRLCNALGGTFGPRYRADDNRTTRTAGQIFHKATGIVFSLIPGGRFRKGMSDEERRALEAIGTDIQWSEDVLPSAQETTIRPFLLGTLPLVEDEAESCVVLDPEVHRPTYREAPEDIVPVFVTRPELETFCETCDFSIPTDSQWEYAYRATSQTLFPWGNDLLSDVELEGKVLLHNFREFREGTAALAANLFGVAGMQVGEWCADPFGLGQSDCPGNESEAARTYVVRGGAANLWPWQDSGEWMLCVSSARWSSEDLEVGCACARMAFNLP